MEPSVCKAAKLHRLSTVFSALSTKFLILKGSEPENMKSYLLHLFRHGIPEGQARQQYIGVTDLPLSTDGIKLLQDLKAEYNYDKPIAVFSSPLQRCVQTAEILFPGQEIHRIADLREYDFGDFERKTAEELKGRSAYEDFLQQGTAPPGGESNEQFSKRICTAFTKLVRDLLKSGITEAALCTHGGIIMTLLAVYGLPRRNMLEWSAPFGEGYTIRITPSIWMRSGMVEVVGVYPQSPYERAEQEDGDSDILWAEKEE